MKIAIIGGGAGGLFFAVLMKRADPSHEITVFERNAPNATFGFGVVFPERSLRYWREADEETHQAFTQASVAWEDIAYWHRGRALRFGGHAFSGIARMGLLTILQARARGLGVDLRFNHEVGDLSGFAGYDLLVGADGVNSLVRRELAREFRPTVHVGRSKFIWLGTTKAFDALTFLFEENTHGWFGVHAYPYSDAASTVIVETDEATWRSAGLDRHADAARAPGASDLESLAYCQALFARHLDGHPLLANNSKWLNFLTVRNRFWHVRNIAILGDAAHTAHFSVGSGTRMAIEDAIALTRALADHADLATALEAYEGERRPAVRRIQRAAEPSRRWWEHYRTWTNSGPERFAFHHLSRTRLLTYGILKVRDVRAVQAVETWFARSVKMPSTGMADDAGDVTPPLSEPLRLRDVLIANRIVADAATPGAGLVMICPTDNTWGRVIESVRRSTPARIGLRLGTLTSADVTGDRLLDHYVRSAQSGAEAGFDLLELSHAAESRGGDKVFALDLFNAIRAAWPISRPICVHLSAWDDPEDDRAVEAGLQFAQVLKSRGCDLVAVSPPRGLAQRDPERAQVEQIFTSDLIRNVAGLPTIIVGGLYTVGDVNALILAGRADLCEWPRLAWPGWRPAQGITPPRQGSIGPPAKSGGA